MTRTDHLREIDDDRLAVFPPDQDVELVKVAMNQTGSSKPHKERHELGVELARIGDLSELTHGVGVDEGHEDAVAGLIDGGWDGEAVGVEDLVDVM
jgi:hypothetical protein